MGGSDHIVAKEKNRYRKLCEGEMGDPPEYLGWVLEELDNPDQVLDRAVEKITAARHSSANERGHDWTSAYDLLKEHAVSDQHHNDLMRLAMHRAQRTHKYWGVSDPDKERYCSLCREAHPIDEFPEGMYRCKEIDDE